MSERTTIGGTVYEAVGSSSSNLLLKCNGTARIQFGSKLIDLIKNGKIASGGDSSNQIFIISDESEIKGDGLYVLNKDDSPQLIVYKNGQKYNLSGEDLYISASRKQDITVEQQKQALENIGMYYNTLADVQSAGIQNGLVYVIEDSTLYTIKSGVVSEFEAKLKTVTVEKEEEQGEVINSSVQIVLSILDNEYLILKDKRITANYDIHVRDSAQIGSESADQYKGYRLYIEGDTSYLDVDKINVRKGLPSQEYTEITYSDLLNSISSSSLESHKWYLITDFQNHWKLFANSSSFNRPILVQALSESSLYEEGKLFKDRNVTIKYDHTYQESLLLTDGVTEITARGRITWMKDSNGNEANFDFLDYSNYLEEPLTTLHETASGDLSIFPANSHDNKITFNNLYETVIVNKLIDNSNTTIVEINAVEMYNNVINDCQGITISDSFTNNKFESIINCQFLGKVNKCIFKSLTNCVVNAGTLANVICYSDITGHTFDASHELLYNPAKHKELYFSDGELKVYGPSEQYFERGMIVMHSGISAIPEGWAICDGQSYEWNGVTSQTPNLINRFIKGVGTIEEVDAYNTNTNNEIKLEKKHLPAHSHPHKAHTHSISGLSGTIDSSGTLTTSLNNSNYVNAVSTTPTTVVTGVTHDGSSTTTASVISSVSTTSQGGSTSGASHTHSLSITGGTISNTTSEENTQTWENEAINIEPNYYALIFIMKL